MNSRRTVLILILGLLIAVVVNPGPVWADRVEITVTGDPPWKISADNVEAFAEQEIYLARGQVIISRDRETLEADQARVHARSQMAELSGTVVLTTPEIKIICQRMILNFEHNIGKIYQGTIYFPENHYYISGDEIERTGPETFLVLNGQASTCDGPAPAWRVTGGRIKVKQDGYATALGAAFETRFFPLLYTPWATLPVNTRRQSGFMIPTFSQSTRHGFTVTQPFYWAVSDSKDMTFYFTNMARTGVETTVEARYNDWGGRGTYFFSYLADQDPPQIDYPPPDGPQRVQDRYWLRGMSDMKTDSGFDIKFDLDIVSDPEYLDEFKRSPTGYETTRRRLQEDFGRELAEPLDQLRKNILQASRTTYNQNLQFTLEYTDNLDDPENRGTIQRLPLIGLDYVRTWLPHTPFYFECASDYNYFFRHLDDFTLEREQGHRFDIHPRLYWPVKISRYLELESSVGFRETLYLPYAIGEGPSERTPGGEEYKFDTRELFDAGLEVSSNFSRVYNLGLSQLPKLKHRIKPVVKYTLVSRQDQTDLPYWDQVDRVAEEQKIRYGLVNYLVAKVKKEPVYPRLKPDGSPDESSGPPRTPEYEYQEILRLGLHRSFSFIDKERQLRPLGLDWSREDRHPHSPWELEAEANWKPYFWTKIATEYDSYADSFTKHTLEAKINDHRGDYLKGAYELNWEPHLWRERNEKEYEEISFLLHTVLTDKLAFQMDERYSLRHNENIESVYALNYRHQCWGLRLEFSDRPSDRSFAVFLSLTGLGEVGGYTYTAEKAPAGTGSNSGKD